MCRNTCYTQVQDNIASGVLTEGQQGDGAGIEERGRRWGGYGDKGGREAETSGRD